MGRDGLGWNFTTIPRVGERICRFQGNGGIEAKGRKSKAKRGEQVKVAQDMAKRKTERGRKKRYCKGLRRRGRSRWRGCPFEGSVRFCFT